MKVVDLYSLINIESPDIYKKMEEKFTFHMKKHEKVTLTKFINKLKTDDMGPVSTKGYIFDYHLIGNEKEFDILKNTKNFILNIELKSDNKSKAEMQSQLIQNRFYLSKTNKKIYNFVYYEEDDIIYMLDKDDGLVNADESLLVKLMNVPYDNTIDIEDLLSPEKFLVSPFNDVEKFMNNEYLLTQSQKAKQKTMSIEPRTLVIGKAGTGKTLLIYDLAKKFLADKKKVLIIHCANLNTGQLTLNAKYGFSISRIKDLSNFKDTLSSFDLVIVDEMQRLTFKQFSLISDSVTTKVIFSGDPKQTLNKNIRNDTREIGEEYLKSNKDIEDFCAEHRIVKIGLSDKIRTNKNLAEFIKGLMDIKYYPKYENTKNISDYVTFSYFNNPVDAINYWNLNIDHKTQQLAIPSALYGVDIYTAFNKKAHMSSFSAIGQEFDSVTTIIGENITYNTRGKLISDGTYYPSSKSLFQNITRTRGKLNFIIINNEKILNRLLDLM